MSDLLSLDSLIPPNETTVVNSDIPGTTALPPIGHELQNNQIGSANGHLPNGNGNSNVTSVIGNNNNSTQLNNAMSSFANIGYLPGLRSGVDLQVERFESQIRTLANEIRSTIQLHVNGLISRRDSLLTQLETIRKIYMAILTSQSRLPAPFGGTSSGSTNGLLAVPTSVALAALRSVSNIPSLPPSDLASINTSIPGPIGSTNGRGIVGSGGGGCSSGGSGNSISGGSGGSGSSSWSNAASSIIDSSFLHPLLLDPDELMPLPKISFNGPDHALYRAITSLGFLNVPAFAPYCTAHGEGLERVIPGSYHNFYINTRNCFNEDIMVGRESVVVSILAYGMSLVPTPIDCTVTDHNNGRYTVSYFISNCSTSATSTSNNICTTNSNSNTSSRGLSYIEITVNVNGILMTGCPFKVKALSVNSSSSWKRVMVYGSEGNLPGQFCRPWGVAIAKYPLCYDLRPPQTLVSPLVSGPLSNCSNVIASPSPATGTSSTSSNISTGNFLIDVAGHSNSSSCSSSNVTNAVHCNTGMASNFGVIAGVTSSSPATGTSSTASSISTGNYLLDVAGHSSCSSNVSSSTSNNSPANAAGVGVHCNTGIGSSYAPRETGFGVSETTTTTTTLSSGRNIYMLAVADRSNNRIQIFKFDTILKSMTHLFNFGSGPGTTAGMFDRPAGICINSALGTIAIADKDNHRIQIFDLYGKFLFKFGSKGVRAGQFCYPWDIDVCSSTNNFVVSDTRNRRVQLFASNGTYITHFAEPLDSPRSVAFLSESKILVSDFNKHFIVMISTCGNGSNGSTCGGGGSNNATPSPSPTFTSRFIGFGEGSNMGEFLRPQGIAVAGNVVYCSDSRNNRICCYNMDTQTYEYLSDELNLDRPSGIAVLDSVMVVVDFGNNRLQICLR